MVAVGVGVAPMIHTLRAIFRDYEERRRRDRKTTESTSIPVEDDIQKHTTSSSSTGSVVDSTQSESTLKIVLLYGVVRLTYKVFTTYY
jgi:hypothetical protein